MIVVLRHRGATLWAALLLAWARAGAVEVQLTGRAVDENGAAVAGAEILVRPAAEGGGAPLRAVADPTGKFAFNLPAPGEYLLSARKEGFFRIENRTVAATAGVTEVTLVLNPVREVFEKVEVAYSPPAIDPDRTASEERLTGTQLLEVPFPSTNTLRNAFRALPGIVQDSSSEVHVNGGAEQQVLYTLDGFQVNDPLTGRFDTRVSVESVRSMDVSAMNPAEFGKGVAGMMAIKTSAGDDRFRYSATNFVPGVENHKGLALTGWTPRFNLSGPIARGRAWFSEGLDLQYDQNIIDELPKGRDRSDRWRAGNLLRSQVNLTPANILFASFLSHVWRADHYGLAADAPVETTIDGRSRQWLVAAKDQWYFARGALLEAGFAVNRVFGREIPQGTAILVNTPEGRRGNAFRDSIRRAGRDQFLSNVFWPAFQWLGGHQLKTGIDLDALDYRQDATRTGYVFLREDGLPSRRVGFGGSGRLSTSNSEAAWYVQDSWRVRPSVLVEAGLRQDWDRQFGHVNLGPRLGVSWAPPRMEATKVSAGYGVVYDETNLELISRPLDQYSLTTHYAADGTPASGPAASVFLRGPGRLKTPRYRNWNAGVEHRFSTDLHARLQYLRRRGENGLMYVNAVGAAGPPLDPAAYGAQSFEAIYRLANLRRDTYDAIELTLRQTFRKQYEWLASYTRSRSRSNAVVDATIDEPLLVENNAGPMPWDTPNRFLSWGYLPAFREKWAVAYLLEARDGFPFSIQNDQGAVVGRVGQYRYPFFFELNLHLERRFVFHRHKWAFRFGYNNLTNRANPNVVINDITSPRFLSMYGGQRRALNLRLRWLGKN